MYIIYYLDLNFNYCLNLINSFGVGERNEYDNCPGKISGNEKLIRTEKKYTDKLKREAVIA